jgi:ATP-dependent DNA helicase RecQ
MADLRIVQAAVAAWPTPPDEAASGDAARRLLDAIADLPRDRCGPGDVAALVRQVLLEDQARFGGDPRLVLPAAAPWPSSDDWLQTGCIARGQGGSLVISAEAWCPPLHEAEDRAAAQAQLMEVYRGPASGRGPSQTEVPADPFWSRTLRHPTYRSIAQRAAARTVALAPGGSTVIVALPTGRGKTDVVWSRALLRDSE